jgi:peroxiredoxin
MQKMKIFRLLTALLLIGAVVEMKAQFGPQKDMDAKYAKELIKAGAVAPDFKMQTPDGKKFQFSKWAKGKTVVIDFWASWCPDCRKDAPEVVRMYREYHQKGIEFLGVSMDTDVEAWKKGIEKFGIEYPQVSELKKFKETDIAKAYGLNWIPSMVVVGPDGKVVLSTVLTYKVDKYLKELTTGAYKLFGGNLKLGANYIRTAVTLPIYETAAKYRGAALIIHGNADRVVPYTYGERFHQIWPGSKFVLQEYFDHGFSQNIYRTTDIVSQFLIKELK